MNSLVRIRTAVASVIVTVSLVAVSSCTKRSGADAGSEVVFSGNLSAVEVLTKVHYTGETSGNVERVSWDVSDDMSIYCEAASEPSTKQAVYTIKDGSSITSSGSKSCAYIVKKRDSDVGLRWGTGEHNFYAACPAVGDAITKSVNANVITADLPYVQSGLALRWSDGNAVVTPDCGNQLLVAKAGPFTEVEGLPDDVFLDFTPLCTTIQFTFKNGRESAIDNIESFELVSEGTQISGGFTVDMDDLTTAGDGFPNVTPQPAGGTLTTEEKTVRIGRNTSLASDKSITFTAFLLPGQDLNDLKFTVNFSDGGKLTTRLGYTDGTGVVFKRCKKSIVEGVVLPDGVQWTIDYTPVLTEWVDDGGETISLF